MIEKKYIEILTEYVRRVEAGEPIELESHYKLGRNEFTPVDCPSWDFTEFEYRFKPAPKIRPYTLLEAQAALIAHPNGTSILYDGREVSVSYVRAFINGTWDFSVNNFKGVDLRLDSHSATKSKWPDGTYMGVIE